LQSLSDYPPSRGADTLSLKKAIEAAIRKMEQPTGGLFRRFPASRPRLRGRIPPPLEAPQPRLTRPWTWRSKLLNPVASLVSVPFQSNWEFFTTDHPNLDRRRLECEAVTSDWRQS
jgi:hypothetical protein